MEIGTNPDYAQDFSAALAWWREAGVDCAFQDEPRSWLPPPQAESDAATRQPERVRREAAPEPPPPPTLDIPDDLAAFQAWWMSAPDLHSGRLSARVAPYGASAPELMIVAPAPESTDRERLLAGPEGRLLDGFLSVAGLDEADLYRASALPCHSAGTDWAPGANRVAAQALARHIALVAPKRLLVLGFVVLPLLGHDSPQGPAVSCIFNHEGRATPLLAVRRPPAPASQPRWKSALWQAWLDWTV